MYNLNPSVMFLASLARSKDRLDNVSSKNCVYGGYFLFLLGTVIHFVGMVTPHWANGADGYVGIWVMCNVTETEANCRLFENPEMWLQITEIFSGMAAGLSVGGMAFIVMGVYQDTLYLAPNVGTFSMFAGLCSLVSVIFFHRQFTRLGTLAEYTYWSFDLQMAGALILISGGVALSMVNMTGYM